MKKLILIPIILFVALSCKKDYVCECTYTPGNSKDEVTIKGVTKSRAKAVCISTSYQEVVGTSTITVSSDCKLK